MAYLSVPKIFRHLTFLHLSSPFIVDNCSHISNLSFAITYRRKMYGELQSIGQKYLCCFENMDNGCFDMMKLSKIIFEMIQAHYRICDKGEWICQKPLRGGFVRNIVLSDGSHWKVEPKSI